MKKNVAVTIALNAALLLGVTNIGLATPILVEWQGGDSGSAFTGWNRSADPALANLQPVADSSVGSLADGSGDGEFVGGALALQVTGPTDDLPHTDIFYTSAFGTDLDVTGYAGLAFDFYADNEAPQDLGFYFQSSTENSIWYYSIDDTYSIDTWHTYHAPFSSVSGWRGYSWAGGNYNLYGAGPAATAFDLAILDVDQLGFYIAYNDPSAVNIYGFDNFGLTVPEPETYMALGMALLGMAFVFRKRITESLDEVRAAIQH